MKSNDCKIVVWFFVLGCCFGVLPLAQAEPSLRQTSAQVAIVDNEEAARQESLRRNVEDILPAQEHRHAIELARQGELDGALERLAVLYAAYPEDRNLFYDYLAVLGWAERDTEAAVLTRQLPLTEAPAYVLEAAGKSLRNTQHFDEALTLYSEARVRFPEWPSFGVGQAYSLADVGCPEQALELIEALRHDFPTDKTIPEAGIYAAQRQNDPVALLTWSQRLLDLAPEHDDAKNACIHALDSLGASHLAEDMAKAWIEREIPTVFANRAAHQVRWGALEPPSKSERFAATDRALTFIDENIAILNPENPADAELIKQARFDRLVALRDRVRMQEAMEEYQELVADRVAMPPYALQAAADAFLYLRQPENARDLYLRVIDAQHGNFFAQIGLFYAYIELEDFDQAVPLIDRLESQEPIWEYKDGSRLPSPNRRRLDAEVTAALARFFGDDLKEAQKRFESMRNLAPRNPDLVRQAGDVQSARGWPRRARESYLQVQRIEPQHLGAQMSLADNHFQLNEFDQAEPLIADLYDRFPENRQIQRILRGWETHNMRELRVGTAYADNTGSEPASKELKLESTLFSAPFLTHYRAFLGWSWSRADFPEGQGIYRRYGAGVEYRDRDLEGTFEISANQASGDDLGLALSGRWHLDDHWSVAFTAELFSRDTPLRALRNGIDANAVSLGIDYLRDESGQWGISGQWMDFSDDNRRIQLSGYRSERLISRPHYKLDARLDLGSGSNSQSDGPYFSPKRDFSAELTFDNRWRLYRRYSFSFAHRVALSGGGYWQRDFGGYPVASLLYEHNWQFHDRLALDYGAVRRRRVYDGDGETGLEYFLRLGWRF
ncbi:MAG: poly-beta-1,6 N-acetyl-D-glucosamine export porin PgaA [Desulfuromonadaceae bacterium]|nr:poly-beta-1,6 N-acetyl-D-glucosamine export porin PgaA [Desulfuromonadaceae bacterium]